MCFQPLTPAQNSLLPIDKHDSSSAILHLAILSPPELEPLIPDLITWLQDENWPIFSSVRDLLLRYPEIVVEPVRTVLRGDDEQWLKNCLEHLVMGMPKECQLRLKAETERVATNPTDDERDWEAEKIASEILKVLDNGTESNAGPSA